MRNFKEKNSDWNTSIKFNRSNKQDDESEQHERDELSDEESCDRLLMVPGLGGGEDNHIDDEDEMTIRANKSSFSPPDLIFNEDKQIENNKRTSGFPNVFHLLQCFTLRSASDAFDLERSSSAFISNIFEIFVLKIKTFKFC